jgi:hypothetical protein
VSIALNLNDPGFQDDFFALEKPEVLACVRTLRKIRQLEWEDIYRDSGLNWEAISSIAGPLNRRLYSFRVSQKFRAVAYRDGNELMLMSLHPDPDSAYR